MTASELRFHSRWWINEYGVSVAWYRVPKKTAVLGDKPVAVLLFPLQVAHDRSGIDPEPPLWEACLIGVIGIYMAVQQCLFWTDVCYGRYDVTRVFTVLCENFLCGTYHCTTPTRHVLAYVLTYLLHGAESASEANLFSASQEFPRILWNPKVHYHTNKWPPLVPILSQLRPVSILSHFHKSSLASGNKKQYLEVNSHAPTGTQGMWNMLASLGPRLRQHCQF